MYKSKYVTLFCVTLHQQPCRPSINLTICLSTSLSYVAITRQSCPTQIYLWQHRPIILSLYFRVDTCLFTDSRTITNIASWCLLMLIHSMVRLLHGAAGRALRSAQLKTGAMYKKKSKADNSTSEMRLWTCLILIMLRGGVQLFKAASITKPTATKAQSENHTDEM